MRIFDYDDYKAFLRDQAAASAEGKRGNHARLARWAACQPSYLSQVLAQAKKHLTLDQMMGICEGVAAGPLETDYLLTLLEQARSTHPALSAHLGRRRERIRKQGGKLSEQIQAEPIPDPRFEYRYASSWIWGAIHVGVSLPGMRRAKDLSARLGIPEKAVESALRELERQGFLRRRKGGAGWDVVRASTHIRPDSPAHAVNHLSWRQKAVHALQSGGAGSAALNLSFAFTLSRRDAKKLRRRLTEELLEIRRVIEPSAPEELYNLNLDFYRI